MNAECTRVHTATTRGCLRSAPSTPTTVIKKMKIGTIHPARHIGFEIQNTANIKAGMNIIATGRSPHSIKDKGLSSDTAKITISANKTRSKDHRPTAFPCVDEHALCNELKNIARLVDVPNFKCGYVVPK